MSCMLTEVLYFCLFEPYFVILLVCHWKFHLSSSFVVGKGECFPYSLPSVGPGPDPGVLAFSLQVTISHPSGGRLPLLYARLRLSSKPQSIITSWSVPVSPARWQRHIGVKNVPTVVTQFLPWVRFEPTTCWLQVQCSTRRATAVLLKWSENV